MKTAIYPGSFDPITNGHLDIVERAANLFDSLIIVVADNPNKKYTFTVQERVEMIKEIVQHLKNVEVDYTSGLTVDYAVSNNMYVCAICAAPSILGHKNLLDGKNAICFPGFEKDLYGAVISDKYAVADGNIITAKGAGSASEFAFEIIRYLCSEEKAQEIKATVQTCY